MLEVRYEELAAEPEKTMCRIAAFLGISFTTALTKPTRLGRDVNDHIDGQRVWIRKEVSKASVGQGADTLKSTDRIYTEHWLAHQMMHLGYLTKVSGLSTARVAGQLYRWARFAAPRYLRDIPDHKLRIPPHRLQPKTRPMNHVTV